MFKTTAIATNIIVFKKKQKTNDILMINVRKKQPECKFIIRVNYQTQHY
ncbi:TPA: N-6 DNA methylase [Salmonella enterica subsp. enterica]